MSHIPEDYLKQRLQAMHQDYQSDWSAMRDRLAEADLSPTGEDSAIDAITKSVLTSQGAHAPDWKAMSAVWATDQSRRTRLWLMAALLLLLIAAGAWYTMTYYAPDDRTSDAIEQAATSIALEQESDESLRFTGSTQDAASGDDRIVVDRQYMSDSPQSSQAGRDIPSVSWSRSSVHDEVKKPLISTRNAEVTTEDDSDLDSKGDETERSLGKIDNATGRTSNAQLDQVSDVKSATDDSNTDLLPVARDISVDQPQQTDSESSSVWSTMERREPSAKSTIVAGEQRNTQALTSLPVLYPKLLLVDKQDAVLDMPGIALDLDKQDPTSHPYLRIGGSARLNYIITPESDDLRFSKYDHSSYSWTLGADYGRTYGDWAWEVGLAYHSLRYDSRNISTFILANPAEDFTTIQARNFQYSIISLPVSIRYDYRHSAQSTAYVKLGASMHYLLSTQYDISAYEVAILMNEPIINEVDNVGPLPRSFERSGFKNNSYTSATLAIGIDRRLGKGMTLYFEPKVDVYLGKGIGPSWDRVHGFSFCTGLLFGL